MSIKMFLNLFCDLRMVTKTKVEINEAGNSEKVSQNQMST